MLLDTSQFGFVKRRPRSKILSVRDYLLVAHYAPMHRTTFRRSVPFMNTFCEGWTQDSNGIMISWLHCTSHPVTHWRIQTTGRDDKHGGEGDHYRGTGGGSEHYGRAAGAGEHYEGPRCLHMVSHSHKSCTLSQKEKARWTKAYA
nr:uncharacterized protein LOC129416401 isoform X7 [Misgurnus anguillicaudatus]